MNLKELKKKLNIKQDPFGLEFKIIMWIFSTRIKKGLTQGELAKKCGMLQASIARIESGRTSPTLRTLERIVRALDTPLKIR